MTGFYFWSLGPGEKTSFGMEEISSYLGEKNYQARIKAIALESIQSVRSPPMRYSGNISDVYHACIMVTSHYWVTIGAAVVISLDAAMFCEREVGGLAGKDIPLAPAPLLDEEP